MYIGVIVLLSLLIGLLVYTSHTECFITAMDGWYINDKIHHTTRMPYVYLVPPNDKTL